MRGEHTCWEPRLSVVGGWTWISPLNLCAQTSRSDLSVWSWPVHHRCQAPLWFVGVWGARSLQSPVLPGISGGVISATAFHFASPLCFQNASGTFCFPLDPCRFSQFSGRAGPSTRDARPCWSLLFEHFQFPGVEVGLEVLPWWRLLSCSCAHSCPF